MTAPLDDAALLAMLDARAAGMTYEKIVRRLGRSRNAVCGLFYRIDRELAAVPDLASRAENRDGGMPPGWWLPGLEART